MSEFGYVLSPDDHAELARLLTWWRRQMALRDPDEFREHPGRASEAYLAVCSSDIPALAPAPGTGTGSAVGLASGAECLLYRVRDGYVGAQTPVGNVKIQPIPFTTMVWNYTTTTISAGTLFLAVQDADGKYLAVGGGGGGGDEVRFSKPSGDGATPPKPKLASHAEVDYDLATDTVYLTGVKYWARDMNL